MITDGQRNTAQRFIALLSEKEGSSYSVRDGPDPPDFLLNSISRTSWLEVTDIYMSEAQAKFVNCREEKTFEFSGTGDETAVRLIDQLNRKLANSNYAQIFRQRGQGILLLTCCDFVFDEVNLARVEQCLAGFTPIDNLGYFSIAYFEYRLPSGYRFYGEVYPGRELPTSPLIRHG